MLTYLCIYISYYSIVAALNLPATLSLAFKPTTHWPLLPTTTARSKLSLTDVQLLHCIVPYICAQDIDARPYTFELGETDSAFKGYHKIERALFRDDNMTAAELYADQLAESAEQLGTALTQLPCTPVQQFEGMIGLALEIGAKKISGEEEAFSDLSVLIFENNWKGIAAVYAPYAAAAPTADAVVKAALKQCDAALASVKGAKAGAAVTAFVGSDYPSYRAVPMTFRAAVLSCTYALASALSDAATEQKVLPDDHIYHANSFFKYKAAAK
jgi:Imelysin